MLANLMPPRAVPSLGAVDVVHAMVHRRGTLVIHPRYRQWLMRHGLDRAEKLLNLQGEIVSGHVDRHVRRVNIGTRTVYLKREHVVRNSVRRRNHAEGFGRVSRAEREAMTLRELERLALPGPQWIAYGTLNNRAFILIDELAPSVELPEVITSGACSKYALCKTVATLFAELHAAGFVTPDAAAKHVFVNPDTAVATLIDWPAARQVESVTLERRIAAWARLHASLPAHLASPRQRVVALARYWKRFRSELPAFQAFMDMVQTFAQRLKSRSSVQLQHTNCNRENLVWLADNEAVVTVASLAHQWPSPPICRPYYPKPEEFVPNGAPLVMTAPDGEPATLRRWRTFAPLSFLRGVLWRSPAAKRSRYLFRCERHGHTAPALLAFGQRRTSWFTVESFLLERQ